MNERIIILDFGSQYTQLIARRVRELNVYSEILPYNKKFQIDEGVKGIILSGSPFSCLDENALQIDLHEFMGKVPVLGICYGAQYTSNFYGGNVIQSTKREYGKAELKIVKVDPFIDGLSEDSQIWMSHGDSITAVPDGFELLAKTESIDVAAYKSSEGKFDNPFYGIQFHPEVTHSLEGQAIFQNFIIKICGCAGSWTPDAFIEMTVNQLREKIGDDSVLLGLSGGVDSSVAAVKTYTVFL